MSKQTKKLEEISHGLRNLLEVLGEINIHDPIEASMAKENAILDLYYWIMKLETTIKETP